MASMRLTLFFTLLTMTLASVAEVYRSVDEDGNVIFSDTPGENAETIELNETTVVPAFKPSARQTWKPPKEEGRGGLYESVVIASPENEHTFRNVTSIKVAVGVKPALRSKEGDRVQLYVDGAAHGGPSASTSFTLTDIERGAHELVAAIVDDGGTELLRSAPTTFFLHRRSVQHPAPAGAR